MFWYYGGCWVVDPWLRTPFQKIKFCSRKCNNYSQIIWKMMYSPYCFHICDTKSTYEDTAVQPAQRFFFTCSSICRTQASQILFCIDKGPTHSFTEVALNSVLEENAIDFAWEVCWNFCRIFILQFNFFLQTVYLFFSQLSHRRFSPVQFDCVLRTVQCVLCTLCANKHVHGFCVFARTMGHTSIIFKSRVVSSIVSECKIRLRFIEDLSINIF